ncbi:MAG: PTS system mannose/fructose/sorbose family transporter subunit IID [Deltaproteobacteria bacterium]|nr:PTS system mannose/fructose/sorbose family transporter subunit IID [Deltaproteobacteria bacterium]
MKKEESHTQKLFWPILWRSFFLQTSWNFAGMQNIGFAYSMAPALKKIWISSMDYKKALARHIRYFNTHPYFVTFILGGVVRLEEEVAAGKREASEVNRFKASYMGSLAAIGDSLFWAGIAPLASLLALLIALRGKLWAPCVAVGVFGIARFLIQFQGLRLGLRSHEELASEIQKMRFTEWAARFKEGSSFLAGVFLAMLGSHPDLRLNPQANLFSFFLFPLVAALFSFCLRRGLNPWQLIVLLWVVFTVGAFSEGILPR